MNDDLYPVIDDLDVLESNAATPLPFRPGDRVRLVSWRDHQNSKLQDREGVVDEVHLNANPDNCRCTVMLDVRGAKILFEADFLEDLIWELLMDEEMPEELPIYYDEYPVQAYFSQLVRVE